MSATATLREWVATRYPSEAGRVRLRDLRYTPRGQLHFAFVVAASAMLGIQLALEPTTGFEWLAFAATVLFLVDSMAVASKELYAVRRDRLRRPEVYDPEGVA